MPDNISPRKDCKRLRGARLGGGRTDSSVLGTLDASMTSCAEGSLPSQPRWEPKCIHRKWQVKRTFADLAALSASASPTRPSAQQVTGTLQATTQSMQCL